MKIFAFSSLNLGLLWPRTNERQRTFKQRNRTTHSASFLLLNFIMLQNNVNSVENSLSWHYGLWLKPELHRVHVLVVEGPVYFIVSLSYWCQVRQLSQHNSLQGGVLYANHSLFITVSSCCLASDHLSALSGTWTSGMSWQATYGYYLLHLNYFLLIKSYSIYSKLDTSNSQHRHWKQ